MTRPGLKVSDEVLADFCRRNAIRKLSFFGSVLRDDFGPDSDVDVLVEFVSKADVSLWDISRMEEEFSELIGRSVHLLTQEEISPYILDQVLNSTEVQYAR